MFFMFLMIPCVSTEPPDCRSGEFRDTNIFQWISCRVCNGEQTIYEWECKQCCAGIVVQLLVSFTRRHGIDFKANIHIISEKNILIVRTGMRHPKLELMKKYI